MLAYLIRRLLLVIPTLLGIMIINFAIIQFVPGGPIEQVIAQIRGMPGDPTARISGSGGELGRKPERSFANDRSDTRYRGAQGLDPTIIKDLEKRFGFDKPPLERFGLMIGRYLTFDFGDSYFRDRSVVRLVIDKMPVSISIGLWTTLFAYLISIPLGIRKAVRDGSPFDVWTSGVVIIGNAIPSFLFAILLIVLFSGGSFLKLFPLRGLVSENFAELSLLGKAADYAWHMALPLTAMVVGGFATITLLTKNSFLEEIHKQYVTTARAKGLTEHRVLYGHVFRNAMLLVIAGFPAAFAGIFFGQAMIIEIIFSLDGLGLLSFESALNRDYPIMFGTLYFFTLFGLVMKIVGDFTYTLVDPRIDFEGRG
jgi:microcin C transport system permease protein